MPSTLAAHHLPRATNDHDAISFVRVLRSPGRSALLDSDCPQLGRGYRHSPTASGGATGQSAEGVVPVHECWPYSSTLFDGVSVHLVAGTRTRGKGFSIRAVGEVVERRSGEGQAHHLSGLRRLSLETVRPPRLAAEVRRERDRLQGIRGVASLLTTMTLE